MTIEHKLSDAQHTALARRLHKAARSGTGTTPPSEEMTYTLDDAYAVRCKLVDMMIAQGGVAKGHKIGFTAAAMQKMYGMTGPDFGQLLDWMFVDAGTPVEIGGLSDTRVEPEIAFEMAAPLRGPGVTLEDALGATGRIRPAIELIDSRVGAMRAKAVDSIADNAGAGRVILGAECFAPDDFRLAEVSVEMIVDRETLTGVGADVMGHPAAPLAWLANKLVELDGLGGSIETGDIVLTGSFTKSAPVHPGSTLTATFGPLGRLDVRFV